MPFSYTINFNDPQQRPEDAPLLIDTRAALDAWSSYTTGKGTVDVQLNLVSLRGGFLADAGPALELAVDKDGARTVTQSNVITELLTGLDVNGAAPDLTINVNADLLSSLYLNPAPSSGGTIPRGKYDAVTILTHELGHALGVSGARDPATGALPANTETTWDRLVALQPDGTAFFTGAAAQTVYGGPVPVTTLKNGEQYYHLANSASDLLSKDLLGGTGLAAGESRSISRLDLAILRDLGLTVSTYDKLQFGTIVHDAQGVGGQVYLLYDALLGRAPDPIGFGAWIDAVQAGTPLRDIAKVIRSKNAGPFEITLDIVFKNREDFEAVKKSGVITRELVSQLYNVPTQAIITFGFFELVNAVKITLPRPRAQGGVGETDMHAAQQHVPLQEIRVPWPAS